MQENSGIYYPDYYVQTGRLMVRMFDDATTMPESMERGCTLNGKKEGSERFADH